MEKRVGKVEMERIMTDGWNDMEGKNVSKEVERKE